MVELVKGISKKNLTRTSSRKDTLGWLRNAELLLNFLGGKLISIITHF